MFFEEMEFDIFYTTNNGFIIIKNHITEDNHETDIVNTLCKTNGEELTLDDQNVFMKMMEDTKEHPKKYTLEIYEGTQELLEKHFGYCWNIEKINNRFYGIIDD